MQLVDALMILWEVNIWSAKDREKRAALGWLLVYSYERFCPPALPGQIGSHSQKDRHQLRAERNKYIFEGRPLDLIRRKLIL